MNFSSPSRRNWLVATIALVMLVVSILIAMLVFLRGRQPDEVVLVPVKTLEPSSLGMTGFSQVPGTEYLVASVSETRRTSSSIYRESYTEDGSVRNLIYLNRQTLESRTLYPNHQQVILASSPFPELPEANPGVLSYDSQPAPVLLPPVRCFIFQTVRADGNSDGRLDFQDPFLIAAADAGGMGYQELIDGVTQIFWMKMSGDQELLIVYEQNGRKQASRINIDSRTITETVPLVDLGAEVK